jgi:zinc transporter zupT
MNLSISNIVFAFLLTLFAGVSTGLGGIAVLKAKITNMKFLAASLGFSAGVMIYVSFVEIFDEGSKQLISTMGDKKGQIISVLSFFAGVAIIGIIDKLIPQESNPHEMVNITELETVCRIDQNSQECIDLTKMYKEKETAALKRTGIFSALAIAIHNFPEGMATFISTLGNPQLGITIAIAIAIHNIPEGISVAIPVYYATNDKKKAILLAFLSGIAEPVGALIGGLILLPFLNNTVMGVVFSMIAGIMVYISLDELLPTAEKYGEHHIAIYGVISGMAVMAISLLLLS